MNSLNKNCVIALLLAVLLCAGCVGTVTPTQVVSQGASFDNGQRNSGFIGWTTNNSVVYGIISAHARDRYNALIDQYGSKNVPPIKKDYGIQSLDGTNYLISLDALSDFAKFNRWHKSGK
jgi:hypothetical protein